MHRQLYELKRVIRVARKPNSEEYKEVSKVTGMGIILVGLIGFLIMVVNHLLGGIITA